MPLFERTCRTTSETGRRIGRVIAPTEAPEITGLLAVAALGRSALDELKVWNKRRYLFEGSSLVPCCIDEPRAPCAKPTLARRLCLIGTCARSFGPPRNSDRAETVVSTLSITNRTLSYPGDDGSCSCQLRLPQNSANK